MHTDGGLDDSGVEDDDDFGDREREQGGPCLAFVRFSASFRHGSPRCRIPRLPVNTGFRRIVDDSSAIVVMDAVHVGLDQLVTVKCLLPQVTARPDAIGRFLRSVCTGRTDRERARGADSRRRTLQSGVPLEKLPTR